MCALVWKLSFRQVQAMNSTVGSLRSSFRLSMASPHSHTELINKYFIFRSISLLWRALTHGWMPTSSAQFSILYALDSASRFLLWDSSAVHWQCNYFTQFNSFLVFTEQERLSNTNSLNTIRIHTAKFSLPFRLLIHLVSLFPLFFCWAQSF